MSGIDCPIPPTIANQAAPVSEWKYSSGHINADMISKALHPPSPETLVGNSALPTLLLLTQIPFLSSLFFLCW